LKDKSLSSEFNIPHQWEQAPGFYTSVGGHLNI